MKREDVKNKIPGITDEQLNWLMQENGADINREKSAATALQTQLNNVNAQLKTAQDGLKAFDGVDVAGLQEQVTKLKADMKAQAEGFAFDNALDAAILSKKGRSVKAVRALLDVDGLKGSADRTADIAKALDEAAKANPWAFGEDEGQTQTGAGRKAAQYDNSPVVPVIPVPRGCFCFVLDFRPKSFVFYTVFFKSGLQCGFAKKKNHQKLTFLGGF